MGGYLFHDEDIEEAVKSFFEDNYGKVPEDFTPTALNKVTELSVLGAEDISELALFPSLKRLHLEHIELNDRSLMPHLDFLEELSLNCVVLLPDKDWILPSLKKLFILGRNSLSMHSILAMKRLEDLHLFMYGKTDLNGIQHLQELKRLTLDTCDILSFRPIVECRFLLYFKIDVRTLQEMTLMRGMEHIIYVWMHCLLHTSNIMIAELPYLENCPQFEKKAMAFDYDNVRYPSDPYYILRLWQLMLKSLDQEIIDYLWEARLENEELPF